MTGHDWCPAAERLGASRPGGDGPDFPDAGPHMIWHSTEGGSFDSNAAFLKQQGFEPHFLYDPKTDRLGQFLPASQTARALPDDGPRRANRVGRPCLQIEVVAFAKDPFTRTAKFGPNFRALGRFLDVWGVPRRWPSGTPPTVLGGDERSRAIYYHRGGHYSHSEVPGSSHTDPGRIHVPTLFEGLYGPEGKNQMTDKEMQELLDAIKQGGNPDVVKWAKSDGSSEVIRVSTAVQRLHDQLNRIEAALDKPSP